MAIVGTVVAMGQPGDSRLLDHTNTTCLVLTPGHYHGYQVTRTGKALDSQVRVVVLAADGSCPLSSLLLLAFDGQEQLTYCTSAKEHVCMYVCLCPLLHCFIYPAVSYLTATSVSLCSLLIYE